MVSTHATEYVDFCYLMLLVRILQRNRINSMYVSIHRIVYLLYIFKEGKLILFKEAITVEFVLGEGDQLSS